MTDAAQPKPNPNLERLSRLEADVAYMRSNCPCVGGGVVTAPSTPDAPLIDIKRSMNVQVKAPKWAKAAGGGSVILVVLLVIMMAMYKPWESAPRPVVVPPPGDAGYRALAIELEWAMDEEQYLRLQALEKQHGSGRIRTGGGN